MAYEFTPEEELILAQLETHEDSRNWPPSLPEKFKFGQTEIRGTAAILRSLALAAKTDGFFGNQVTTVADVDYVIQDDDTHVIFTRPLTEEYTYLVWPDAAPENRGRVILVTMPNTNYVVWRTVSEGGTVTADTAGWLPPFDNSFGYWATRTWVMVSSGNPNAGWGAIGNWYSSEHREPFAPNLENSGVGHVILQTETEWAAGPLPEIHPPERVVTTINPEGLETDLFELNGRQLFRYMGKLTVWVHILTTVIVEPYTYDYVQQLARTAYSVNLLIAEDGTQSLDLAVVATEVDSIVSAGAISLEVTAIQTPHPSTGTVVLHLEITSDQYLPEDDPGGSSTVTVTAYYEDPVTNLSWVTPFPFE